MTFCSSPLEPTSDRTFDTCLARLRDPDVQSLLDSLDVDPPPRLAVSSPCCPPLTPPLTPLSPQHTPVATATDMLQSVRDLGLPLRRHSFLAETPVTPVEER